MLHRSLVKFIIDCLAQSEGVVGAEAPQGECGLVTHLLDYAQYKISFEELYFQTLSHMSTFCEQYENNDLRFETAMCVVWVWVCGWVWLWVWLWLCVCV